MAETGSSYAAEVVISGVPKPLTYSFPSDMPVEIGSEVTVELGRRQTQGWVVRTMPMGEAIRSLDQAGPVGRPIQLELLPLSDRRLRPIRACLPAFLSDQMPLFRWMAEFYGSSILQVIENAVPRRQGSRSLLLCKLTDEGQKLINCSEQSASNFGKRARVQYKILEKLNRSQQPVSVAELAALAKTARAVVKRLHTQNLLEVFEEDCLDYLFPPAGTNVRAPGASVPTLTEFQKRAVESIHDQLDKKTFAPALLFGVTGSGKTEVYLRAIEKVLAEGGSILVIVPEIALTPQLFDQFSSRLGVPLSLLHSQVGPGARWKAWENLLQGRTQVAIGARSAIFAPLRNLRLIVVDEEHDSSYKQSDGLRYHARDVAIMRAKLAGATVLLGSATPSFEALLNVKRGKFSFFQLPERVCSRPLPKIEVVDLNSIKRGEMPSENISPQLATAITETLTRKEQIILLYNRRGFSTYLQCESCSEVLTCPNCSVSMTYHRGRDRVLCHYCNQSMSTPKYCLSCRNFRTMRFEGADGTAPESSEAAEKFGLLTPRGAGTEKVVDELGSLFPGARIVRLDRDTTSRRDSYRKILGSMRTGEADILVGTQMIAKGHDLPGVTLVGIIDADVGLHIPDFRSSERTFQLITQAAGRAGRGDEPGRVIVQTREPNHPTIVATTTARFTAFARYELDFRQKLLYPPCGRLLRVIVSSTDQQDAYRGSEAVRTLLARLISSLTPQSISAEGPANGPGLNLLGPAPAPHLKLKGRYRWHLLVKSQSSRAISQVAAVLNRWKVSQTDFPSLRVAVDIDPHDML